MSTLDVGKKKCSYCGEDIAENSRRCPYCGSTFEAKYQYHDDMYKSNENRIETEDEKESLPAENVNVNTVPGLEEMDYKRGVSETGPSENRKSSEDVGKSSTYTSHNTYNSQHRPQNIPDHTSKQQASFSERSSPGNGLKVFITATATIIPGLGQLVGIIIAILFMNSENDDKRSFGVALMVTSLIVFLISCAIWFTVAMIIAAPVSY